MKRFPFAAALVLGLVSVPIGAEEPAEPAAPKPAPAAESPFKTPKEKLSYALGRSIGKGFKTQGVDADFEVLLRGIRDGYAGKSLMTDEESRATIMAFQQAANARMAARNRKAGEAFLAANKTKEGVNVTESGLQYKILTAGDGKKPGPDDTVTVHYRGTLIDGREFDSSYRRGQPAKFKVGGVIKGWAEALQLMPVGSKWQLVIPSTLAYGSRGMGRVIGPNSVLVFEVELISIP
jgi:FKBP-type peptidyl-prolyl cis-trans isomerase FklB